MAWIEKGQPTRFDQQPIHGLFFLDGDLLNRKRPLPWAEGNTFPTIVFPSGAQCDLDPHPDPTNATVNLYSALRLPLFDTPYHAFTQAQRFSKEQWYEVSMPDPQTILVVGDADERVIVQYDAEKRQMINVIYEREGKAQPYPITALFPDDIHAKLPTYSPDNPPSLDDLAPVRFDTPDGSYLWYAAAYDGKDTFYGLVVGVENMSRLTTFSLSDLATLRDSFGYAVSCDYLYEPKTLREVRAEPSSILAAAAEREPNVHPTNWVSKEDLLYARPDLRDRIFELDENDVAQIARLVGDALLLPYQISLKVVLAEYLNLPEDASTTPDTL